MVLYLADRSVRNRYNTCISLRATSLNPFFSKRHTISPTSLRWTPSGFTAMKVRSFTPVQPRGKDDIKQEISANYHLSKIKQLAVMSKQTEIELQAKLSLKVNLLFLNLATHKCMKLYFLQVQPWNWLSLKKKKTKALNQCFSGDNEGKQLWKESIFELLELFTHLWNCSWRQDDPFTEETENNFIYLFFIINSRNTCLAD